MDKAYKKKKEVKKMVTALNVSNNILFRAFDAGIDVTPMKLQKLLFFVYKRYLKETNRPLFNERFEVWKYGPVIRSVYDNFKQYKSNSIKDYYKECNGAVIVGNEEQSAAFKEALDYVWERYGLYNGIKLSQLTHRPGTAWKAARESNNVFLEDDKILEEPFLC